jgi:RNase P subunit RPR2
MKARLFCPKCTCVIPKSFKVEYEDGRGRTRVICKPCWYKWMRAQ